MKASLEKNDTNQSRLGMNTIVLPEIPLEDSKANTFFDLNNDEVMRNVRIRKANIDLLKESIEHIRQTYDYILSPEEKDIKASEIQKEIDFTYQALQMTYGLSKEQVDAIEMINGDTETNRKRYVERLAKKGITPEMNEKKDISKDIEIKELKSSTLVKKLNLSVKHDNLGSNNVSDGEEPKLSLSEKLGLAMKK